MYLLGSYYTELVIDNEGIELREGSRGRGKGESIQSGLYIPPVLLMREGGIPAVDISHLSNFFQKLQFKNA